MASGRFTAIDGVDIWHRVEGQGPWLVRLDGVGHYSQLEAPERAAAAVVRFIETAG